MNSHQTNVRFLPAGDTGLVVEFGDRVDRALSERVLRLSSSVRSSNIPGVIETVPTYRSLLVLYDPLVVAYARLVASLEQCLRSDDHQSFPSRRWRIPACYEPSYAPDLLEVAQRTNRSVDDVIHAHASVWFYVYMIGFAPGHPYLGDLPDWLSLPRRPDPRVKVPAGSIGIAGNMTVVYSMETPGGWNLIGAVPVRLFDLRWPEPSLLKAGDQVRFEPVKSSEFDEIQTAAAAGDYRINPEAGNP